MPLRTTVLLALMGVLSGVRPGFGQPLAEVARQEAERRKTVKDGGKVYTNKDLPTPPPAEPAPLASSATALEPGGKAEPASKKEAALENEAKPKDRAYWGQQMKDLRDQLDRDQIYVDALQSRVNALTTEFVNRDDPAQQGRIAADRHKAIAELDRLKKQVVDDKRAIADFEEEARRGGVPPGWLR